MNARSYRPQARWLALGAVPLLAFAATTASAYEGDPSYTYFGAAYVWNDVNYAVKNEGGEHQGVNLEASLGLLETGRFGVHLYGEFFDGEFASNIAIDDGLGNVTGVPDGDSQGFMVGAGVSFALAEAVDLVGRAMYADTEVDLPDASGNLAAVDGDGYVLQALVRGMVGERVEIEAGYRYTDIDDSASSGISNNDILLGLTYSITPQIAVRARGIVFDDDSGLEIGARWYFGKLYGRDFIL